MTADEELLAPHRLVGDHGGDYLVYVLFLELEAELGHVGDVAVLAEPRELPAVNLGALPVVVDSDLGVVRGLRRIQAGEVLEVAGSALRSPYLEVHVLPGLGHVDHLRPEVLEAVLPSLEARDEQQDGIGGGGIVTRGAEVVPHEMNIVAIGGRRLVGP